MSEYRRSGSRGRNPLPAIGAVVATIAVVGALAFVVLGGSTPPDPARPTPAGTSISAPEPREVALAVTSTVTPLPTIAPPTATAAPKATSRAALPTTPTPRADPPTRTPRAGLPPTSTPLPNVQVSPTRTAPQPSATAAARATQTAVARKRGTPGAGDAEVLEPVDGGTVDVAWDGTDSDGGIGQDAALVEPVYEEAAPVEQPTFGDGSNSGFDALATAQAQQAVMQEPVYQQPVFQEPVYQQPVFQEPVYEQPVFDSPVFDQPIVVEIPDIVVPTPNIPQYTTPGRNFEPRPVSSAAPRTKNAGVGGALKATDARRKADTRSRQQRQSHRSEGRAANDGRRR
jgi:hypothetical protein